MTSLYVYALLPSETDLPDDLRGFHDAPCFVAPAGDLLAVVASHEGQSLTPTPELVQAHHEVVVRLREHLPALPVQFGTVMRDAQELLEVVRERQDALHHDMRRLAGKVEFGISVLWGAAWDDLPAQETASQPARTGAEYMQRRLVEHRQEEQRRELAEALESDVRDRLQGIVTEDEYSLLSTRKMPLRARFLVDAVEAEEFQSRFQALRQEHDEFRFMLVGPWPPYSFVSPGERLLPGTLGAEGGKERPSLSET